MAAKKKGQSAGRAGKKARQKTAQKKSITREEYKAALILDLQDSTTVWDQNATLAREAINKLDELVKKRLKEFQGGEIGNFTGDGFLVLFNSSEDAIDFARGLIGDWEKPRKDFEQKFAKALGAKIQT